MEDPSLENASVVFPVRLVRRQDCNVILDMGPKRVSNSCHKAVTVEMAWRERIDYEEAIYINLEEGNHAEVGVGDMEESDEE